MGVGFPPATRYSLNIATWPSRARLLQPAAALAPDRAANLAAGEPLQQRADAAALQRLGVAERPVGEVQVALRLAER